MVQVLARSVELRPSYRPKMPENWQKIDGSLGDAVAMCDSHFNGI